MKRGFTLTAGIIATILMSLLTGGIIFYLYIFGPLFARASAGIIILGLFVFIGVLSIIALILNIIGITAFSCSPEKYKKKKGCIVTAIVFNFILWFFSIVSLFKTDNLTDSFGTIGLIILILFLIGTVLSNFFYSIDLGREESKVQKLHQKDELGKVKETSKN